MSEEIKQCPACGKNYVKLLKLGSMVYVACMDLPCGVTGPSNACAEEAIAAWNALPRALVWTTKPPKGDGWYFVRSICPVSGIAGTVEIEQRVSGQNAVRERYTTQWAGPIPEPQDPRP